MFLFLSRICQNVGCLQRHRHFFLSLVYHIQLKVLEIVCKMELKDYDLIGLIGEGSYGKVFKATEKATNRCIAVKLIPKVCIENCFSFI